LEQKLGIVVGLLGEAEEELPMIGMGGLLDLVVKVEEGMEEICLERGQLQQHRTPVVAEVVVEIMAVMVAPVL
jgi:hypothetical protein